MFPYLPERIPVTFTEETILDFDRKRIDEGKYFVKLFDGVSNGSLVDP